MRGGMKKHARHALVLVIAATLFSCAGGSRQDNAYPNPVPLQVAGLLGDGTGPTVTISPREARGASYLPGTNVLRLANGDLRYLPPGASKPSTVPPGDPGASAAANASRDWLFGGTVPGASPNERSIAERALLDLRLLTDENGATLAAPHSRWAYVWPRDASFAAVAFAATGHHEEAYEILRFLASVQEDDGGWEARYHRSGEPVLDGRARQLDATGWFPWAAWFVHVTDPDVARATARSRELWPAVRAAADEAVESLESNDLPPGGADYWEIPTWRSNLGTAAPLRTGLRSAAALADELGHEKESQRYAEAADRLDAAIEREFAPNGYPRTTHPDSGADAAVTFLAPPFAPEDPAVRAAVDRASERLAAPNGGVLPGERWPQDPTVSWTPETAFFALTAASSGDEREADRRLDWLAAHRTELGSFPEKVDGEEKPQAAAPLAWTSALVVLTLAAAEEPLPEPPE